MFKSVLKIATFVVCFLCFGVITFANDNVLHKDEILYSHKIYNFNAIDPTTNNNKQGSYYPGMRGANQLIIYTPLYGLRTNTNEFGTEAIVEGNVVTSLSGADSIIPNNGLVISGHGKAKKWINENIIVGAKVYVDRLNKQLNVYVTSDSYIFSAKEKIKETQEIVNYYRRRMLDYDYKKPCYYIQRAEKYLKKAERSPRDVQKYSGQAIENANAALDYSIPYLKDELRGVWIRPTEKTPEAIIATLDKLQAAGINNIFLETYFHGKTIFPSKTMNNYMFQDQNEAFVGFDPLSVWISEAHKRDIKVNIWFESFYVGNKNPQYYPKSILAVRPTWANVTKKNFDSKTPVPSISEHNGYFLDPANPEVQTFLCELIYEIICNYKPDGINLDYIRYPQSIAAKFSSYDLSNWGYTDYARMEFKDLYGVEPLDLVYSDPNWALWDKYRRDKISDFVRKVSQMTKRNNILLTAVIFPDRQKALETKQQDWKKWSHEGYVNGFTPLLLTSDSETAALMMKDVNNNKTSDTALYAGLFSTFMGASEEDLLRQVHTSRKMKAKGVILFDYAHLSQKYVDILMASAFNKNSTLEEQQRIANQNSKCKKFKVRKRG